MIEQYEYLILLLVHFKAFRESKDPFGQNYYETILPEEVPLHRRLGMNSLEEFVILRDMKKIRKKLPKKKDEEDTKSEVNEELGNSTNSLFDEQVVKKEKEKLISEIESNLDDINVSMFDKKPTGNQQEKKTKPKEPSLEDQEKMLLRQIEILQEQLKSIRMKKQQVSQSASQQNEKTIDEPSPTQEQKPSNNEPKNSSQQPDQKPVETNLPSPKPSPAKQQEEEAEDLSMAEENLSAEQIFITGDMSVQYDIDPNSVAREQESSPSTMENHSSRAPPLFDPSTLNFNPLSVVNPNITSLDDSCFDPEENIFDQSTTTGGEEEEQESNQPAKQEQLEDSTKQNFEKKQTPKRENPFVFGVEDVSDISSDDEHVVVGQGTLDTSKVQKEEEKKFMESLTEQLNEEIPQVRRHST